MFDLSRITTLHTFDEWLSIIRTHDKDIPILLIGSKYDVISDYMDKNEIDDLTDYVIGIQKSNNLFDFIITSSKIGFNIDHAFSVLLEKARNHLNIKSIFDKFS